jgi:hypothetical protein
MILASRELLNMDLGKSLLCGGKLNTLQVVDGLSERQVLGIDHAQADLHTVVQLHILLIVFLLLLHVLSSGLI